ncbi:hypothetical protein QVD17_11942 [Tagetes erecta]|uniref:Transmembrane 9 superfamily member n=1 Tax=Tagetes erecta TaxID=13708 RepID=A0AAD8P2H5_TARER|nr:hypothetical protein QVD17_11942 [Tagetes erecta]
MADQVQLGFSFHHFIIFVFHLLFFIHGHSFYLDGVDPHDYYKGDHIAVKANKLASSKARKLYSYYSIPYCRPDNIVNSVVNLGDMLRGDRIQNSLYVFQMRVPTMCNVVCRIKLDEKTSKDLKDKIDNEYRANMVLDKLPLVVRINDSQSGYQLGYFVGRKERCPNTKVEKYFINNHLSFLVKFHQNAERGTARIVGFEVKAFSINHIYDDQWSKMTHLTTCDPNTKRLVTPSHPAQEVDDNKDIIFTYDVDYRESNIKWASRWDTYLLLVDDQIPWFSIMHSFVIVLSISGMVAMIILRKIHRDIFKYDQLQTLEDAQEETGWKIVHMDVFRPPVNSELLCVYVGNGVQFFGMILIVIIFGVFGFLSSSNKDGIITIILVLWALMGIFGGFATARLYKTFQGSEQKNMRTTFKTSCMFPGIIYSMLVILNVLTWAKESEGAIRSDIMFNLLFLWLGISVPLVYIGSNIGSKESEIKDPVKTNNVVREIPEQPWYMNPSFLIMVGGILPFRAVFNELFFMLTSIGLHHFYNVAGLVFIILIITCSEIAILICYFQLCGEDYQWWWRSYLTAGSSAFYFLIYATFYFFTRLNITELVPGVLYFGYMLIASYMLFVLTGTIGFYACLWFIRLIYSSVKVI